jgi:hypothetical protein
MSTEAQEAQARSGGWKPKEEFTGDQSRWVEADIFLEKGEKVLPIVQKDRDQLRVKVDKQGKQIEKLLESNKQFGEYTKGQADKLRNENTRLLSELEASQAQAITDGDGQAFTRLNKEIEGVKRDLTPPPYGQQQLTPDAQRWKDENSWYETNQKLQIYADGLSEVIVREGFAGQNYWKELTRRVKDDFPDEFRNPNQDRANSVEDSGGQANMDTKARSYDNLPDYARESCDDFVKSGLITQEDYVKTFEWDK